MTDIYEEKDFVKAKKQKKIVLASYFTVLGVLLAACIGVLIYYILQPYATPLKTPLIIAESAISFVGIVFSFIFLGIVYNRTRAYAKEMKAIQTGLKETTTCAYKGIGEDETKDGVDFSVLVFMYWFAKKSAYFERNVLVDKEKKLPEFVKGDLVKFVTQGNVLVSYEVVGFDDTIVNLNKEVEL